LPDGPPSRPRRLPCASQLVPGHQRCAPLPSRCQYPAMSQSRPHPAALLAKVRHALLLERPRAADTRGWSIPGAVIADPTSAMIGSREGRGDRRQAEVPWSGVTATGRPRPLAAMLARRALERAAGRKTAARLRWSRRSPSLRAATAARCLRRARTDMVFLRLAEPSGVPQRVPASQPSAEKSTGLAPRVPSTAWLNGKRSANGPRAEPIAAVRNL